MQLSNTQMGQYIQALNNISDKVSGKIAYAVARNIRKIANEGVEYDTMRQQIVEKYGEKTDKGFIVPNDSPNFAQALKEIEEISDIEHDVDIFMVSDEDICNTDLTAKDILSIDFMIKESAE